MTDWYATAKAGEDSTLVRVGTDGEIQYRNLTVHSVSFLGSSPNVGGTGVGLLTAGGVWTCANSGVDLDLYDVTWAGAAFVAVGRGGVILYSLTGANWTRILSPTALDLYGIGSKGSLVMAVGQAGTIIYSRDTGITWETLVSGVAVDLYSITMDNSFIATGDNDTILMGQVESTSLMVTVGESLALIEQNDTKGILGEIALDTIQYDEGLFPGFFCYANDELGLDATDSVGMRLGAINPEAMAFGTRAYDAHEALRDLFSLSGSITGSYHGLLTDSATLAAAMSHAYLARPELTDGIALDEAAGLGNILLTLVRDDVGISGVVSTPMRYSEILVDGMLLGLFTGPAGTVNETWVMTVENRAVSTYENYAFNSLAAAKFGSFATDGEAIYELDAEDDDGKAIDAYLRTGTLDFGTAYIKNVERAYIGARSDGDMVLKTITNEGVENWYLVKKVKDAKDGLHERRAVFGKGAKARYWQFEMHNKAGADFELESLSLVPINLSRRY